MSEVQKELEKAKMNETAGNFEKAAKSFLKVAELTTGDQSIRLYNKAFFTSRKSANTHLMYTLGKTYYEILQAEKKEDKIRDLIPTFLEITGRMRDQQAEQSPEEAMDVFNWSINLYLNLGNEDAAFEISQEAGDTFFAYGQEFLSSSHLRGKEEKWQRGLDLFDEAINVYQLTRLNKEALEKITTVKLDKIAKLIDIGRHKEAIKNTTELLNYFSSQDTGIQPYSKDELTLKIAKILAKKSLEKASNKKFEVANVLQNSAKAGFETSGNFTEIGPFLWSLSQVFDELDQKELFFSLVDDTFETSLKYQDETIQSSIFEYLESRGKSISENIINSRLLMVKKGPIEFNNHEGLQYFFKSMDLAVKIDDTNIPDNITKFLFQYAQTMYDKKLKFRALPYLKFCAQTWWGLPNGSTQTKDIISYLDTKYNELLNEGRIEDASKYLENIFSIKFFIKDEENAGDSALSFAQIAGRVSKDKIELEFLERALNAYSRIEAKNKLQILLDTIINRSDPLFNTKSKYKAPREKFIELGNLVAAEISQETQGEFLQATTFKSFNSGLIEFGVELTEKAFEVQKKYDPHLAADLYFKAGSLLIEANIEKAIEFIKNSTEFAAEHEPSQDLVDRNLNYLMEITLSANILETKLFLINKFELITEIINRNVIFNEFLFTFTQNLAESISEPEYYSQTKIFLEKTFMVFYSLNKEHIKLKEVLAWTNEHIMEKYSTDKNELLQEMTLLNLSFYEKMKESTKLIEFFWPVFEIFASTEDYKNALELYKELNHFLNRLDVPSEIRHNLTGKVASNLNRVIKPMIQDEKFEEAWTIIENLFSVLKISGLESQAIDLYKENATLFADMRLDLALKMWSKIIDLAKTQDDSEAIFSSITSTMNDELIPKYTERDLPQAVNQLYSQVIEINKIAGNTEKVKELLLLAVRYQLTTGNFDNLLEWGKKGFNLSIELKDENSVMEYSNMFFAVGRSLLAEQPEIGIELITTASNSLRDYGPFGQDLYFTKISEMYEDLLQNPATQELAQSEREHILTHFRESGNKKEEGNFLLTTGRLSFETGQFKEGFNLITQATDLFQAIEDEDGLAEVVSFCLKTGSKFGLSSQEYQILSQHAAKIQGSGVEISEDKTQDAFGDLFDGMLEDMTSLMDPSKRKKKQKKKKR